MPWCCLLHPRGMKLCVEALLTNDAKSCSDCSSGIVKGVVLVVSHSDTAPSGKDTAWIHLSKCLTPYKAQQVSLPFIRRHYMLTSRWTFPLHLGWVLPGGCADPSAVRLLAGLPYRMSRQAQCVQTGGFSLAAFPWPLHPIGRGSVALLPCCLPWAEVPALVS